MSLIQITSPVCQVSSVRSQEPGYCCDTIDTGDPGTRAGDDVNDVLRRYSHCDEGYFSPMDHNNELDSLSVKC